MLLFPWNHFSFPAYSVEFSGIKGDTIFFFSIFFLPVLIQILNKEKSFSNSAVAFNYLCGLLENVNENSNSSNRARHTVKINWAKWHSISLFHPKHGNGAICGIHSCRRSPSCLQSGVCYSMEVQISNICHCTLSVVTKEDFCISY